MTDCSTFLAAIAESGKSFAVIESGFQWVSKATKYTPNFPTVQGEVELTDDDYVLKRADGSMEVLEDYELEERYQLTQDLNGRWIKALARNQEFYAYQVNRDVEVTFEDDDRHFKLKRGDFFVGRAPFSYLDTEDSFMVLSQHAFKSSFKRKMAHQDPNLAKSAQSFIQFLNSGNGVASPLSFNVSNQ